MQPSKDTKRIEAAVEEANAAFWSVIVEHFPEATTGDFLANCEDPMTEWVTHWVHLNADKPELEVEQKTVFKVDYNDLDDFISEVYGHRYEIVADEELSNYSSKEFDIKKEVLDDYDSKSLQEFIDDGKGQFNARLILIDLCNKGLIEEGDYIIKIYW